MSKLLIFNFDGTSNEPEDAVQGVDRKGAIDDDNITNVLKFHLLCGGHLKSSAPEGRQRSFYYSGIGTHGNFFQRLFNAGLANEAWDVSSLLSKALKDFEASHYQPGDIVLLTGFSRGAALARRFAAIINRQVADQCIYEAVFDTVASIGLPNLSSSERPLSEVVFENGCTLPSNVCQALHLVSLDDKRKAFQPTLMNKDDRVQEVWFAGAHSDVGGGYYFDGLSDISLRFMLNWLEDKLESIKLFAPSELEFDSLVEDEAGYEIKIDDISIEPDPLGKNHEQERSALTRWATLTDRRLCVIREDKVSLQDKPIVFESVARRIERDRNYRPRSLQHVNHMVLYEDGHTEEFSGLAEHKEGRLLRMRRLKPGDTVKTRAYAYNPFNNTGILLEKDKNYTLLVEGDQTWRDGQIKCDANGWHREEVRLGATEVAIAGMEPFKRYPDANWFCLIGCIDEDDKTAFKVGREAFVVPTESGELCLFANDLERFYGNNFGMLNVTIKCEI